MTRRNVMISVAALLAAVVGIELLIGSRDRPLETAKAGGGEMPVKAVNMSIEFPPIDRYSECVERPLFSSTRKPFQPSDKTPGNLSGAATASSFDLELSGITLSGTQKLALIKTKRDNAQHRVGRGEEFRGWTLEEVLADKVVMINGAQTQELALIRKGDPLAAKRKKLQKQSQKRKQQTAKAHAEDKKAEHPGQHGATEDQDHQREAPAEPVSEEEQ